MAIMQTARVAQINTPCDDVRLLTLDLGQRVAYEPGSHLDFHFDIDGAPAQRSYSLIGNPDGSTLVRIAVRRVPDSRGGSAHMWQLAVGAELGCTSPKNGFPLSRRSVPRILVAGGIGITPIIGMAERLMADGLAFQMVYAGRSSDSMPFVRELRERLGDKLHLFDASRGEVIDFANVLSELAVDGEMYVCGPIGMLNTARQAWAAGGRRPVDLHFETFAAGGSYPNRRFRVSVPRLGLDLEVGADATILETLEAAGVDPLFNCRKGECGLCLATVEDQTGLLDHRDVFLSEHQKAENKQLCICVSRLSEGTLVLNLP